MAAASAAAAPCAAAQAVAAPLRCPPGGLQRVRLAQSVTSACPARAAAPRGRRRGPAAPRAAASGPPPPRRAGPPPPPPLGPPAGDDIDDLILDENYYADYGMTRDDALRQQLLSNVEEDPDAMAADAADLDAPFGVAGAGSSSTGPRLPAGARRRIEELEPYGPEVGLVGGLLWLSVRLRVVLVRWYVRSCAQPNIYKHVHARAHATHTRTHACTNVALPH